MRVHPSQIVTGCIVTKAIMGKTSRPIIPKNTVVNHVHIKVLHKFQIESVEVANKLSDGSLFKPSEPEDEAGQIPEVETQDGDTSITFQDQYLEAVHAYKKWFMNWRSGAPIDIHSIRQVMVPLLEKAIDSNRDVFLLHHYCSVREYPYHHSVAVGLLSGFLASKMGYNYGEWIQIGLAGLLSDSGMSRVEERIIHKRGSLTEQEYEKIKQHPVYSYRLVENVTSLSNGAKLAILQHHEHLDGSGYPLGVGQNKLHPFSHIIAVSDMYHAMTSERVYRKKQSPFKVLEEVLKEQFGRYDYKVIQVFVNEMANYSTGTEVKLSNDQMAEIIFVEKAHPTKPMVRLINDEEILHLKDHRNLHIEEIFD